MARPMAAATAGLYVLYAAQAASRLGPGAAGSPILVTAVEGLAALALAAIAHLAAAGLEAEDLGCFRRLLYAAAGCGCLTAILVPAAGAAGGAGEIAALVCVLGMALVSAALAAALCAC